MSVSQAGSGKWRAQVRLPNSGPHFHVGTYDTKEEAYNAAAIEYQRLRDGTSIALRPDKTMPLTDFATEINVRYGTIKRWASEGMPALVIGRTLRVEPEAARAWILTNHAGSVAFGRKGYIYFYLRDTDNAVKIGWTSDIFRRNKEIRKESSCQDAQLVLLASFPGDKPDELRMHAKFEHLKIEREWFRYEGDLRLAVEGFGNLFLGLTTFSPIARLTSEMS